MILGVKVLRLVLMVCGLGYWPLLKSASFFQSNFASVFLEAEFFLCIFFFAQFFNEAFDSAWGNGEGFFERKEERCRFLLFGLFQPASIIDHAKSEQKEGNACARQPGYLLGLSIGDSGHCGEGNPAEEFDENPSWEREGNAELGHEPKSGNQREQAANAGSYEHFAL